MSKVWFVTGSSRGLGRAIVEGALAAGNRVIATARKPEQLADLVARYPDTVRALALDVADNASVKRVVAEAHGLFGQLDVVVNNAGYGDIAAIEDVTDADFKAQIDTNFYGTVYVTKAALPFLRQQGHGHIIQITSIGGRLHSIGLAGYQSAKWAVEGFSGILAQEVAPLGIKVTIVEPGGFRTDWAGSSMTIPPVSAPYQQTVGVRADLMRSGAFKPAGDPDKAAQVLLQVVDLPEPPLRLILGTSAYEMVTAFDADKAAADKQWLYLTNATEAED
jgi:NAD(P)-dependent dehydrogenase (short-subunit alcohol dehydrogenase family)